MNLQSIPVLFAAAITLYVGWSQLLFCRRHVRRRHHFLFALSCLLVSIYDILAAGLYNSQSFAEGIVWQRAQLSILPLVGLSVVWFVHDYSFQRSKRTFYVFALYFLLAAAAGIWAPNGMVLTEQPAIKEISLPLGIQVVYWEAATGPLAVVESLVGILALIYVFIVAVQGYRFHNKRKYGLLLAALAIFCVGVLNDVAVAGGLYDFLYMIEYSFMGIVALMAFALAEEVATAMAAQEQLRTSHERFSAVFKNAAVGIALIDARKRFLSANDAICGMLGRSQAEMTKALLPECVHEEDVSEIMPSVGSIFGGTLDAFRRECRYLQPDGRAYWGDMSFGVVHTPDGGIAGMIWIVVGITERRRAVDELCSLNENLERKVAARTAELETANTRISESLALLRQDEEAGRMIQFNLLPEEHKTIGHYGFTRYLAPSLFVSGDFVSYFEIDEDHVGFYIADVSGHGVSSAFITVVLYSLIHNCLEHYVTERDPTILDPKSILAKLNAELVQHGSGKYITIFYGVLNQRSNSLTFANGGQFPPPMIRAGSRTETISATGSAVGLFDFSKYENHRLQLPDEFALFAFSDGILEILEPESLKEKLSLLKSAIETTGRGMEDVVAQFGVDGTESLPDDITVLLLERKATRARR